MAISPNTNCYILKVPIEINNKNQLTFANKEAQYNYFNSLEKIEIHQVNYIRKDNILMFPAHIDSIMEYNYCMYQNENYNNKWFYAFIVKMEYENNGTTKIYLVTDTWQTWQFDLQFKQSFVEREMVNTADDIQGSNLLDEGIEIGEPIVNSQITDSNLEPYFIIAYSGDYIEFNNVQTQIPQESALINGIPTAIAYLICEGSFTYSAMIEIINACGMGDKIFTCFTVPKITFEQYYHPYIMNSITETNLPCCIVSGGIFPGVEGNLTFNKNTSLDGYTPRNKKLLNYPYNYIGFTALNGDKKIYKFEDFNGNPSFKLLSELNPNPSIIYRPINYRKSSNGLNDVAILKGYPTLSYKNDYYNSWLAQNSNIISLQMQQEEYNYSIDTIKTPIQSLGNMIGQASDLKGETVVTGATLGLELASLDVNHEFYVKQQMAQKEKQSLLPDTINLGSSATLIGYNLLDKNVFSIFTMKREYAERADKFFDMYGYLSNTVKVPNLNNRPNWNYIKTIGLNVIADIPQEDLEQIKIIFDNGVTLWHNPTTFLDYSQNNR